MLLASPMNAMRNPFEPAALLQQREAIGQHLAGMQQVRKPVMTGTAACCASSTRVPCAKVRAMMRSTQRSRLRAMSATDSRLAELDVLVRQVHRIATELADPTSKVTRVRRLGFSKIIAAISPRVKAVAGPPSSHA